MMKLKDFMLLYSQEQISVIESQVQYEFDVDNLVNELADAEIVNIYGNEGGTVTVKLDVMDGFIEATWYELYD